MAHPFLILDDKTEIVHPDMKPDSTVKVYLERPDVEQGFRHATRYLPSYAWEDIVGFTKAAINRYQQMIESTAHLIMEFSQEGRFYSTANLLNWLLLGVPGTTGAVL